jgi:hypothetical protein
MQFQGQLPESVLDLLNNCPQSGSGQRLVHRWIMEVGVRLRHYVLIETAADLILRSISRQPKHREIEDTLRRAYSTGAMPDLFRPNNWPAPNARLIDDIVTENDCGTPGLELLRARSAPIPKTAAEIFALMFPPDSLLCAGLYQSNCTIAPVSRFKGLERFQFVVPNPMRERFVIDSATKKRSERCLANVAERRYIVADFDLKGDWIGPVLNRWARVKYTPQDGMATLITFLTTSPWDGELSLVVFSGNKSLQAWYRCDSESADHVAAWFNDACMLGADPAGWVTCQYFRMPGAMRKDPIAKQEVVFFNPDALKTQSVSNAPNA